MLQHHDSRRYDSCSKSTLGFQPVGQRSAIRCLSDSNCDEGSKLMATLLALAEVFALLGLSQLNVMNVQVIKWQLGETKCLLQRIYSQLFTQFWFQLAPPSKSSCFATILPCRASRGFFAVDSRLAIQKCPELAVFRRELLILGCTVYQTLTTV